MDPRQPVGTRSLLSALGVFFFLAFLVRPLSAAENPALPFLAIFHTSDLHGQALAPQGDDSRPTNIDFPRMKTFLNNYPARHKMLLDAGDSLHGRPFATAGRGQFMALMLKKMAYDALALGNHDFDYGLARVMELRDALGLNYLAANIIEREDGAFLLPPYLVKDFEGFKIGVFALSNPQTPSLTAPGNVENVKFLDAGQTAAMAREMVRRLREEEKVQLVVALTHLGLEAGSPLSSLDLVRQAPGLDLVIDGHSHRRITGLKEGGSLIVSAGQYLETLGLVELRRTPDGSLILSAQLIPAADFERVEPDRALAALGRQLEEKLAKEMNQVVTRSPIFLDGDRAALTRSSTSLGRVVGAALMKATGADLALINGGSIRGSLPAGEITRGQLLEALPFNNYAVTLEISGRDLLEALQTGLDQSGRGGFPQIYGLTVTSIEGRIPAGATRRQRQLVVEAGGRPLEVDARYTLVTNDFLQSGGDGYESLARPSAHVYSTVEEILGRFLAEASVETLKAIAAEEPLTIIVEE